jgi:hypothetical protein
MPGMIGDDFLGVNAAGRPMRIPWDAELGQYDPGADDPLWWLSFADPGRPSGTQFLGVAVVQAPTFSAAIVRSHRIGANPGGEVASMGPLPPGSIAAEWHDRLLSAAEVGAMPGPR